MWFFRLALAILVGLTASCGYHLSSSAPITLPEGMTRLFLEEIDNPTTESWLEPALRSALRDELSRRGRIEWVDKDRAEGLVRLDIEQYTASAKLENAKEQTVKSEVRLRLRGRIFRSRDHHLLWESGTVLATESFVGPREGTEQREAQRQVVDLAVEKLADNLGQGF
jgi:outer membrane lipopolysaccharide assembly protein LptE/RlpB